jgi:hypothetical protein
MPKSLRSRAAALRDAARNYAEGDRPEYLELARLMLEVADELEAAADREEMATGQTPPAEACC